MAVAATAAILGGLAGVAAAKPDQPKPKPKPKLTLLTQTEEEVFRKEAIKVGVESKGGEKVRVEARFVVDGFPEDFVFRLGPDGQEASRPRGHGESSTSARASSRCSTSRSRAAAARASTSRRPPRSAPAG